MLLGCTDRSCPRGGERGAEGGDCEHGALALERRYAGYAGDQLLAAVSSRAISTRKPGHDLGDVFAVGDQRGAGGGAEADAGNPAVGDVEAEAGGVAVGVGADACLRSASGADAVAAVAALEQLADGEARRARCSRLRGRRRSSVRSVPPQQISFQPAGGGEDHQHDHHDQEDQREASARNCRCSARTTADSRGRGWRPRTRRRRRR